MDCVAQAHDDKYVLSIYQDEVAESPRGWGNLGTMVCWHRRYNLGDEQPGGDPDEWLTGMAAEFSGRDPEVFERYRELLLASAKDRAPSPHLYSVEHNIEFDPDDERLMQREHNQAVGEAHRVYGDKIMSIIDEHAVMLPLALLDHSGLHMYVSSKDHWSDPGGWDSGQVGWIYIERDKLLEEFYLRHGKPMGEFTQEVRKYGERVLRQEVETYDQYLRGDVYGFVLKVLDREQMEEDGIECIEDAIANDLFIDDEEDSCWGFYGHDWDESGIAEHLPEDARHLVKELR